MSKVKEVSSHNNEPSVITPEVGDYASKLGHAFNWYNREKEKKDARVYLRSYILQSTNKDDVKIFDRVPDYEIISTWGWVARLVSNGSILTPKHQDDFKNYLSKILDRKIEPVVETEKPSKPSVRDNMEEKVKEYLGELEGAIDDCIINGNQLDLMGDFKARGIPLAYCSYIEEFIRQKAGEYIYVMESEDEQVKEAYSNLGKRKLTALIKMVNQWLEDVSRYSQYKKANKKPRARKVKSPIQQVSKLKFRKEDTELGIKSVNPTDIVGASQVWVYNSKYKKLAVYRTDSATGIQVKGTTLQNYDPDMCEQKTLRKPGETIKQVLEGGKIVLRKILTELKTKDTKVNGRINEECLIIRAIK